MPSITSPEYWKLQQKWHILWRDLLAVEDVQHCINHETVSRRFNGTPKDIDGLVKAYESMFLTRNPTGTYNLDTLLAAPRRMMILLTHFQWIVWEEVPSCRELMSKIVDMAANVLANSPTSSVHAPSGADDTLPPYGARLPASESSSDYDSPCTAEGSTFVPQQTTFDRVTTEPSIDGQVMAENPLRASEGGSGTLRTASTRSSPAVAGTEYFDCGAASDLSCQRPRSEYLSVQQTSRVLCGKLGDTGWGSIVLPAWGDNDSSSSSSPPPTRTADNVARVADGNMSTATLEYPKANAALSVETDLADLRDLFPGANHLQPSGVDADGWVIFR